MTDAQKMRAAQAESRRLRDHLATLTQTVVSAVAWIDEYARQEASRERGKALANTVNVLEMANDRARYGGLGIDFRKDVKRPLPLAQPGPQDGGAAHG